METYQAALQYEFYSIAKSNDLVPDGENDFYPIFAPEDFCKKAYDYCNRQYKNLNDDKLMFEYCLTAFYGCICSALLWNKNPSLFENTDPWNAISGQIDVEFTDYHAEQLLRTCRGEYKAEAIFAIINEYYLFSKDAMIEYNLAEDVCIYVMTVAYKLGILVAKKELEFLKKAFRMFVDN